MASATLTPHNRSQIRALLERHSSVVACLCAEWCDVCKQYRDGFGRLAASHDDTLFLWIDIEDNADIVGDLEVENFPTLLMQHGQIVAFYGPTLPDGHIAERLLQAQLASDEGALAQEAAGSEERRHWQRECNLRDRINHLE